MYTDNTQGFLLLTKVGIPSKAEAHPCMYSTARSTYGSSSFGHHHNMGASSSYHQGHQREEIGREVDDMSASSFTSRLASSLGWFNGGAAVMDDYDNNTPLFSRFSHRTNLVPSLFYRALPTILISALLFSAGVISGLKLLSPSSSLKEESSLATAQEKVNSHFTPSTSKPHRNDKQKGASLIHLQQAEGKAVTGRGKKEQQQQQHRHSTVLLASTSSTRSDTRAMESSIISTEEDEEASEACIGNAAFPWTVSSCSCDGSLPVLGGVDVVAYFYLPSSSASDEYAADSEDTTTTHIDGSVNYQAQLNGYIFWFSTAENKALFEGDPWKYAPMYGGFCSWGMSEEIPPSYNWNPRNLGPSGNIDVWLIYNDHLFLFLEATPKGKFEEDISTYMMDGTLRWNAWFGSKETSPFNTACVASES